MTLLYFVLLVGVLIFVHELGHFLLAKLFDVKVLRFSLGFGPKALGFRAGETEYCVCWIPLGGYVKMLGEDARDEITHQDQGRAFHQKALWKRYLIVAAGPAFNLIFPVCIYFLFFASQTALPPAVVGKVYYGQPAAEAGLVPGDRVVAIDGSPIRYWKDFQRFIYEHPGVSLRFTIERDGKRIERFVTPQERVSRNQIGLKERFGLVGISPFFELAQVGISDPASAAAKAGLRTGDLITSVNGKPIERWIELEQLLSRNRGRSLRISFLRPTPVMHLADLQRLEPQTTVVDPAAQHEAARTIYEHGIHPAELYVRDVEENSPASKLGLKPGDRIAAFDGQPIRHWQMMLLALEADRDKQHMLSWIPYGGAERSGSFRLERIRFVDDYKNEQVRYVFGAYNRLLWKGVDPVPIERRFTFAVVESVRRTSEIVGMMAMVMVQLFRGGISGDAIGGPVMLAYTAGIAAEKGWEEFLRMMALISINLGMINLLPIPILDGGHILFFTVEAIKRRPLSRRAREIAAYVGLCFLVSLMIVALKNDIVRYWFR